MTQKKKTRDKRGKREEVNLFRRPIVCPPDGAGRGRKIRTLGYLARIAVLVFAVFGFSFFLTDAFRFHYAAEVVDYRGRVEFVDVPVTGTVFLAALLIVSLFSVLALFPKVRRIALPVLFGGALALLVTGIVLPDFGAACLAVPKTLVNSILERLHRVNYLTLVPLLPNASAGLNEEFRVKAAASLLTFVIALVFVPFLIRRTRILPPVIFSSAVLLFIFVCNITRSNWALAFLIASFCALIVMCAYDGLYRRPPRKEDFDTTADLFPDPDRPVLSDEAREAETAEAERKAARKEAKSAKREEAREKRKARKEKPTVTVDEELNDYYFRDPSRTKTASRRDALTRLTPAERKAEKQAKRDGKRREVLEREAKERRIRASRRQVLAYDRMTEDSRVAAGGLAGLAVFLLMMLVLLLPTVTVESKFQTIPAIDEKLEFCREYLTALLVGDEDVLDKLDYEQDRNNFLPRSVGLYSRYYSGEPLFYVRARSVQNLYMKDWVAVDFRDDAWYAVTTETMDAYREHFGLQDFPAEEIRTHFYTTYLADVLTDPEDGETDWLKELDYYPAYGVIMEQVSIERVDEGGSSMVYLPSVYVNRFGLRVFEDTEESELGFVNYFDGILTGRDLKEADPASYSALVYATTMRDPYFMERLAERIAAYNANETLITLWRDGYFTDRDKSPAIERIDTEADDGFIYRATYEPIGVSVDTYYDLSGALYETVILTDGAPYDLSRFESYALRMTKTEKAEAEQAIERYEAYRAFVYETYLDASVTVGPDGDGIPSEILAAIADEIAADYRAELDAYAAGEIYTPEHFEARHNFIRAVVDYLAEHCTYLAYDEETFDVVIDPSTLPYDEDLNAIENFLTVTKQGYCVQFATALTLLLREEGIPARYVEGYIVSGLNRDRGYREPVYDATVRDYSQHAWVEVWFDGIGWVEYEATPGEYYDGMYPKEEVDVPPSGDPEPEPVPTPVPEPEPEPDPEPEIDPDKMTEEERLAYEEALRRAELLRKLKIALAVVGCVLLLLATVLLIVFLAMRKERARDRLIERVKERKFDGEERRAVAFDLIDHMTELLALYGLAPHPGELHGEYADRLFEVMPAVFGAVVPIEGDDSAPSPVFTYEIDARSLFLAVDAEEFGGGMTEREMRDLAEFYSRLRTQKRRFIPPVRRFFLRYFGHKI